MLCPSCNHTLTQETLHTEVVERCEKCDGLWLDDGELRSVLSRASGVAAGGEVAVQTSPAFCPRCKCVMTLQNYAHDSGVVISKCGGCDGVWLIRGQLEALALHQRGTPSVNRLADAMADDMRVDKRWSTLSLVLRSRWLSGSVAVVFLLLASTGGLRAVWAMARFLAFPLLAIWFCDALGTRSQVFLGFGRSSVSQRTPAEFIALGGWLILIALIVVWWLTLMSR